MPSIRDRLRYYRYLIRQRRSGQYVFIHINKCGGTSVEAALGIPIKLHDTARLRRLKIGRRRWEQAFTFALVRHPYSRVISLYKFRVQTNQTGLGDQPVELNAWVRRAFGEKDPTYYDKPRMFAPCFDWVSDRSGRIIVDYIAKLETIEDQWPVIQERTGKTAPLPVRNASGPGLGWDVLDDEARRIIRRHFLKDFEVFGYEP
jgi:hypothetical protein